MHAYKDLEASATPETRPEPQPETSDFPGGYGEKIIPAPVVHDQLHPLHLSQSKPYKQGFPPGLQVVQPIGKVEIVMMQSDERPPSYCILSILSIVIFFPMGICAGLHSLSSNTSADIGDMTRARFEGLHARNLSIGAIVLGIFVIIVLVASLTSVVHGYS